MVAKTKDAKDLGDTGVPEIRTLADLARLAGVSAGTVSRALAGKSLVNTQTRERIQELARVHGFRPNQMASKLRSQRTGVIGVVIPLGHERRQHISDPFFMTLIGHLADTLTESGYDLMLSRVIPEEKQDWLERVTGSGMVDGVIVIGQSDQFDRIEAMALTYRPLVAWGHWQQGQVHCAVGTDNSLGGRMAAEYLIARGGRSLAFLGDTRGIEIARRLEGAAAAAREAGVSLVHIPVHLSNEETEAAIREAFRAECTPVDGIVAASDVIAMSALKELHALGRDVPREVQVIGFDDLPFASQTVPPLTTIRQDIANGAKALVARLAERIAGKSSPGLVMLPQLVERSTTRTERRSGDYSG